MLIVAHLSLMIAAALCLIAGVGTAMFGRKKKFWLKWHKSFNTIGFCLFAAGATMAFANVMTSAGHHLAGSHQWIGLIAFILTCITVSLGYYSFKAANKPAALSLHRWIGRLSGLAILSALTLGLMMIGIL
jgi:cytochrome b561